MLKLSSSRKVSPLNPFGPNAKGKGSKVKNAFSLPSVISCPGSTPVCREFCYAGRDERRFPNVKRLVDSNFAELKACGRSVNKMAEMLSEVVNQFRADFTKRGLDLVFRIHESGDFFSVPYAKAWARVVRENPDISFWAYTRSWKGKVNVIPILAGIPNLVIYCSIDVDSVGHESQIDEWKAQGVYIALSAPADEVQEISVNLTGRKSPVCPSISGKIPLVSEGGEGACIKCGMCLTHERA